LLQVFGGEERNMSTSESFGGFSVKALGFLLILTFVSGSNAASLGLVTGYPDITALSADVVYAFDAQCFMTGQTSGSSGTCGTGPYGGPLDEASSSGTLTVTDTSLAVRPDNSNLSPVSGGSYTLTALFSGAGIFQSGTVSSTGTALDPSAIFDDFRSGTLVTGDLSELGFGGSDQAGIIEFSFNNIGGDLGTLASGDNGGIIISFFNMSPTWAGDWDPSLNNNPAFWQRSFTASNASVDTFIPVPAAVWLFGSGLLGFAGIARRRQ
jgi:hypothetical protein